MMKRILIAALALAGAASVAFAAETPAGSANGAMSTNQLQLAQSAGRHYCLTCRGEKPKNNRYTCWDDTSITELGARLRGDFLCLREFGNPIYMIGEGKCSTKRYCKTIRK